MAARVQSRSTVGKSDTTEWVQPPGEYKRKAPEAGATLIAELETGLRIDEHDLNGALLVQPDLLYRVSKEYALVQSRRDEQKQLMAELEAQADADVRETAIRQKEKLTETEIKNLVRLDKDVMAGSSRLIEANRQLGDIGALKEAFVARGHVLRELVSLYVNNYYISNSDGAASSRLRDVGVRDTKAQLNKARRERDPDGYG